MGVVVGVVVGWLLGVGVVVGMGAGVAGLGWCACWAVDGGGWDELAALAPLHPLNHRLYQLSLYYQRMANEL